MHARAIVGKPILHKDALLDNHLTVLIQHPRSTNPVEFVAFITTTFLQNTWGNDMIDVEKDECVEAGHAAPMFRALGWVQGRRSPVA